MCVCVCVQTMPWPKCEGLSLALKQDIFYGKKKQRLVSVQPVLLMHAAGPILRITRAAKESCSIKIQNIVVLPNFFLLFSGFFPTQIIFNTLQIHLSRSQ